MRYETNKIMLYERLISRGTSVLKNFVTTLLHRILEKNPFSGLVKCLTRLQGYFFFSLT